jgi:hypothetical protein
LSAPSPTSHYRFLHHGLPHRCLPGLRRSSPSSTERDIQCVVHTRAASPPSSPTTVAPLTFPIHGGLHRAPPFHRLADSSSLFSTLYKASPSPCIFAPIFLLSPRAQRSCTSSSPSEAERASRPSLDSPARSPSGASCSHRELREDKPTPPPLPDAGAPLATRVPEVSSSVCIRNRAGSHLQIRPLRFVPVLGEHTSALPSISSLHSAYSRVSKPPDS